MGFSRVVEQFYFFLLFFNFYIFFVKSISSTMKIAPGLGIFCLVLHLRCQWTGVCGCGNGGGQRPNGGLMGGQWPGGQWPGVVRIENQPVEEWSSCLLSCQQRLTQGNGQDTSEFEKNLLEALQLRAKMRKSLDGLENAALADTNKNGDERAEADERADADDLVNSILKYSRLNAIQKPSRVKRRSCKGSWGNCTGNPSICCKGFGIANACLYLPIFGYRCL